jgi:hypothetical protein
MENGTWDWGADDEDAYDIASKNIAPWHFAEATVNKVKRGKRPMSTQIKVHHCLKNRTGQLFLIDAIKDLCNIALKRKLNEKEREGLSLMLRLASYTRVMTDRTGTNADTGFDVATIFRSDKNDFTEVRSAKRVPKKFQVPGAPDPTIPVADLNLEAFDLSTFTNSLRAVEPTVKYAGSAEYLLNTVYLPMSKPKFEGGPCHSMQTKVGSDIVTHMLRRVGLEQYKHYAVAVSWLAAEGSRLSDEHLRVILPYIRRAAGELPARAVRTSAQFRSVTYTLYSTDVGMDEWFNMLNRAMNAIGD